MQASRQFDVIVYGATGFTGELVAQYLMQQYGCGSGLDWAIAGRNSDKLEAVKKRLGSEAAELPVVVADSNDAKTLASLAASTRVVLTTVGPYALYGSKLVAACVHAGTDYCDLAGEVQWIRRMIDKHHDNATESGARIVHCCGFDSIPMDMGVHFLQQEAKQRYDRYCQEIALFVKATKGSASGGTLASMINTIEEARADRDIARMLANPYALNPDGERDGSDRRDQTSVVLDDDAGCWTAPFVMAVINTRVVRRSHALAGYPYGRDFRYREAVITGSGTSGWLKGQGVALTLGGLVTGISFEPTRKLLQALVLPAPGEGPDDDAREAGFFNLMQVGKLEDGTEMRTRITGDRDPGYGSTSKMLAEAAVSLAMNESPAAGGCWTPASALGDALYRRLTAQAGLAFELE